MLCTASPLVRTNSKLLFQEASFHSVRWKHSPIFSSTQFELFKLKHNCLYPSLILTQVFFFFLYPFLSAVSASPQKDKLLTFKIIVLYRGPSTAIQYKYLFRKGNISIAENKTETIISFTVEAKRVISLCM